MKITSRPNAADLLLEIMEDIALLQLDVFAGVDMDLPNELKVIYDKVSILRRAMDLDLVV